jgi:formamidopyrimidine-DNA glycosylase
VPAESPSGEPDGSCGNRDRYEEPLSADADALQADVRDRANRSGCHVPLASVEHRWPFAAEHVAQHTADRDGHAAEQHGGDERDVCVKCASRPEDGEQTEPDGVDHFDQGGVDAIAEGRDEGGDDEAGDEQAPVVEGENSAVDEDVAHHPAGEPVDDRKRADADDVHFPPSRCDRARVREGSDGGDLDDVEGGHRHVAEHARPIGVDRSFWSWEHAGMPEMPEVESLARWLTERTSGLAIERVDVLAISALRTFDPPIDALRGKVVSRWSRRGKFLIAHAGDLFLCIHLARAGWIRWSDQQKADAKARLGKGPQALRVVFSDGSGFLATEQGTDKRLSVHVVRSIDDVEQIRTLGVEVLSDDFTLERFADVLAAAGRSQIKGVLTDQATIAGIGNAYSDEALHVAKMSPFGQSSSIAADPAAVARLYGAITEVMSDALARSAGKPASELKDSKRTGMRVHGRTGLPCPVCGDVVREVAFASKSLQYCATCQTGGKPLADRRLSKLLK